MHFTHTRTANVCVAETVRRVRTANGCAMRAFVLNVENMQQAAAATMRSTIFSSLVNRIICIRCRRTHTHTHTPRLTYRSTKCVPILLKPFSNSQLEIHIFENCIFDFNRIFIEQRDCILQLKCSRWTRKWQQQKCEKKKTYRVRGLSLPIHWIISLPLQYKKKNDLCVQRAANKTAINKWPTHPHASQS